MGEPHDALFRAVLAEPAHAAALLRHLLPPGLAAAVRPEHLQPAPGGADGPRLRQHRADLLFVVRHPELGEPVHLLLEHKSGRDHRLARQLVRYVVALGSSRSTRRGLPPFFVPVVVHHGARPMGELAWRPPRRKGRGTSDLFLRLRSFDPRLDAIVWDLTHVTEAQLRAARLPPIVGLCLAFLQFVPKSAADPLVAFLHRHADPLREVAAAPGGHLGIERLHSYVLHVTEVSAERVAAAFASILLLDPGNPMTSTAQRLRAEGKAEGKAELLLRLAAARFGAVPAALAEQIGRADADALDALGLRLLDATTPDDLLRDRSARPDER